MDQVEHVDRRRHIAKPGLTGLWQVSGRKEVPWSERMRMDLEYIENWSLAGDVLLVIRTLGAVVTGRGAM
jgi:lipopolysaccharide/colanic/teichoic acid biosynthesis glycosyltransferase